MLLCQSVVEPLDLLFDSTRWLRQQSFHCFCCRDSPERFVPPFWLWHPICTATDSSSLQYRSNQKYLQRHMAQWCVKSVNHLFLIFCFSLSSTFIVIFHPVSCSRSVCVPMFDQISIQVETNASGASQTANGSGHLNSSNAFSLCYRGIIRKDFFDLHNGFPVFSGLSSIFMTFGSLRPTHLVLDVAIILFADHNKLSPPSRRSRPSIAKEFQLVPFSLAACVR